MTFHKFIVGVKIFVGKMRTHRAAKIVKTFILKSEKWKIRKKNKNKKTKTKQKPKNFKLNIIFHLTLITSTAIFTFIPPS